jgi:hypothetical protein
MTTLFMNGYAYEPIDGGEEGGAVRERYGSEDPGIYSFTFQGQPAIYFNGQIYIRGRQVSQNGNWVQKLKEMTSR